MKKKGEKITCLTAYDYSFASLVESAGIDIILVGDSLGMVIQGRDSTLGVTLSEAVYHTKCVSRAVKNSLILADMPFGTFQSCPESAFDNAAILMGQGGANMVKIEGGGAMAETVNFLVARGVPVCGHLGLTPQSIYKFGTYTVRAKEEAEAEQLIIDAQMLEKAGCFGIVLEKIPAKLANKVSQIVNIPIIGIGAGAQVDGQVLVLNDMLGMNKEFSPRFLRRYLNLDEEISKAVKNYTTDVKNQDFPNIKEQY